MAGKGACITSLLFSDCVCLAGDCGQKFPGKGTKFSPSVRFLGTPHPGSLLTVFRLIPDNICPFCSSGCQLLEMSTSPLDAMQTELSSANIHNVGRSLCWALGAHSGLCPWAGRLRPCLGHSNEDYLYPLSSAMGRWRGTGGGGL